MVTDLTQVLAEGTELLIETGEYSDYSCHGPIRMLVTATKQELVDAYRAEWKSEDFQSWRDEPNPDDFVPWLIKTGRAEDKQEVTNRWHIGSYSRFKP